MSKVVLIFMSIFSLLLSTACGNRDIEAAEKIQNYLIEKYDEEFVVDRIGGGYGTLTTNTLKAYVYPKNDRDKEFKVEVTKDLDQVWDDYMNVLMSEKLDKVAGEMASSVFGGEVVVKSGLNSGGLSFPDVNLNEKNMDIREYFKIDPNMSIGLDVFVKSDSQINIEEQAGYIAKMADEFLQFGQESAIFDVYYVKQNVFENIEKVYNKTENMYDYYINPEQSHNNSWVQIEEFKRVHSLEEIKQNFLNK